MSELPIEPLSDRQQGTSDRAADSESDQKPAKSVDKFQPEKFHRYPFYSPRFWHGMRIGPWYRLLRAGRFRIHPSRIGPLIGVSFAAPINSLLAGTQRVLFGRKLAAAEFHGPPVFIVGHWRSGTTLLHELMVRDDRLSSPSTFQCFVPSHFHVSEWFFRRFAWWLLPGKRPMDNMAAGFDHPQEDEFALLVLGMPSPYRRIAFPNQGPVDLDYLDFDGVPQEDVDRWLAALRQFLLSVSSATGRPLVVKSPTHTGRIGQLAREFPEAKFIHITRNPRELFPSTCRLWHSLDEVQALQKPDGKGIPEYVIECFRRMYQSFHVGREQVDSNRLIDIRYEDLKRDPVGTLRHIYEALHLGDFESVQPSIERWVQSEHKEYKANQHQLAADTERQIRVAWKDYFEKYGYE